MTDPQFSLPRSIADILRGSSDRILVTGASGWIGRATLHLLSDCLGHQFARRVVAFSSKAGEIHLCNNGIVQTHDLRSLHTLPSTPTLLLHYAFLTQEKAARFAAKEYVAANCGITTTVLSAAKHIGVVAAATTSSGAAYKASGDFEEDTRAGQLYAHCKRIEESAFAEWSDKYRCPVSIARVFNLGGPYINKHDSYALSSMLMDALANRTIRVRSAHPVFRSYLAICNLVAALLYSVLRPENSSVQIFDACGTEVVEIGHLAEEIRYALRKPNLEISRESRLTSEIDLYVGNPTLFQALLSHHSGSIDLRQIIRATADYLSGDQGLSGFWTPRQYSTTPKVLNS